MQVAVAGTLGRRIGVLEATAFGAIVAAIVVVSVTAAVNRGLGGIADGLSLPPWLWLGGVMGAIVVTSLSYSPSRIGTFATIAILVAGQLAAGVAIDALGLFGQERIPLTAARIAGLVLLAAGAGLVLRR